MTYYKYCHIILDKASNKHLELFSNEMDWKKDLMEFMGFDNPVFASNFKLTVTYSLTVVNKEQLEASKNVMEDNKDMLKRLAENEVENCDPDLVYDSTDGVICLDELPFDYKEIDNRRLWGVIPRNFKLKIKEWGSGDTEVREGVFEFFVKKYFGFDTFTEYYKSPVYENSKESPIEMDYDRVKSLR